MTTCLAVPARKRILSGILTVLAATAGVACDDDFEGNVSYRPETRRNDVGDVWPALPCLPKDDPKLQSLAACGAEDIRVSSGPTQATDANGQALCSYRMSYTVPSGEACVVGRPLVDAGGHARTAALVITDAWNGRSAEGWSLQAPPRSAASSVRGALVLESPTHQVCTMGA